MAFTDTQRKALKAKLNHRHVKSREQDGVPLSYVEGWHVIAEANRIFGFDSWDRQTQSPECHWSAVQRGQTVCFYSTKVRITVRAGGTVTVREGIGTGLGRSPSPDLAHELALKAAETDATKRALATFGNPFGLALYDRDQTQVTKPRKTLSPGPSPSGQLLVLAIADDREQRFDDTAPFTAATLAAIEGIATVDDVYAFWTRNLGAFTLLHQCQHSPDGETEPVRVIVEALKRRLRQISDPRSARPAHQALTVAQPAKSALLIPKEKRIRDRVHLAFVASQPCLVCGRRPAQAHHVRFAQPRAMSMKVSDEFTLPLCNIHHDSVHKTGDERAWWARHGVIDPLKFAERLWNASRLDAHRLTIAEADTPSGPDNAVNGAPASTSAPTRPEQ